MKKSKTLYYDEVVAIEPMLEENVYDFVIPDTHCFFANGILVHNCSQIEQDADGVSLLWSDEDIHNYDQSKLFPVKLSIEKNKDGASGIDEDLLFDRRLMIFRDEAPTRYVVKDNEF